MSSNIIPPVNKNILLNTQTQGVIKVRYLYIFVLTILLSACVGGGDTDSGTNPNIIGWGSPPNVSAPSTTNEAKQYLSKASTVSQSFNSNIREFSKTMGGKEALQKAIDDLKNNSDVIAVTYSSKAVFIYLEKGEPIVALLDAEYRLAPENINNRQLNKRDYNSGLKSKHSSSRFVQQRISPTGSRKALIISGYQNDFGEDLCPIKSSFEDANYTVDLVVDKSMCGTQGTNFGENIINYMNSFDKYDAIYINTHGNINLIATGIYYDINTNPPIELLNFVTTGGVGFLTSGTVYITADYINNQYGTKNLSNTYVHVDACLTGVAENDGSILLADAFINNGAAAYISYNNTTQYNVQTKEFTTPFIENLSNVNTSIETARAGLPQHWTLKEREDCTFFFFDCQIIEEESVDVVIRTSQAVQNDAEGFMLVPFTYKISSVSPNPIQAGRTLVINGSGFNGVSDKSISLYNRQTTGGLILPSDSYTDTRITVDIPATAVAGNYEIFIGNHTEINTDNVSGTPITVIDQQLVKPGTVKGLVEDALTGNPLMGARISVFKDGNKINNRTTTSTGEYSLSLSEGDYIFTVKATGYIEETIYIHVTHNETTTISRLRQIPDAGQGDGIGKGKIFDAINGNSVGGVTLQARKGNNAKIGTVNDTTITSSIGMFTFNLPAGNYTVEASKGGYTTIYFGLLVVGNHTTDKQNASMTPNITAGEVRVVLSWGSLPGDLDSHLATPSIQGSKYHIYWNNRGSQYSRPFTKLDVDRTDLSVASSSTLNGPETITIYESKQGLYNYYVHNYSSTDSNSVQGSIINSRAKVDIYSSQGLIKSFNVPNSGTGTYWNVFTYDGISGNITPVNTITSSARN